MSAANCKWHFPSTDGGDEDGINNSGLQTFEGNHEAAIARECIQNSLDAIKNQKLPVKVQIQFLEINTSEIPGIEELKRDIIAAKEFAGDTMGANIFFSKAVSTLNNSKISVLRIGDYNTKGLVGGDSDKNGSWYSLARSNGFSQKSEADSGGSFGIGKNAPFVASNIRTVFYSTLNENGEHIFQGKACLSSFKQGDDVKRGTGQYGQEAQRGVASIRNDADIPELFKRTETGTDIFVIGYQHPDGKWKDALIKGILDNFFVAIYYKKLVVEILESNEFLPVVIDDKSLESYITTYFKDNNSEDDVTWAYYQAIVNSTKHFEENLEPFGKVALFVKSGVGNKSILGMRKPLMKIHTFKNFKRAYDDFAGVFIALDDEGNKLLKGIEPPAHNQWDPELCRLGNCATTQDVTALKKWLREKLESMNADTNKHPEEIDDLAKYLPYDEADSDLPSTPSNNGNTSDENKKESADEIPQTPIMQPFESAPKRPLVFIKPGTANTDTPSDGIKIPVNPGSRKPAHNNAHVERDPKGNARFLDIANLNIKTHEIRRDGGRVYVFNILPKSDDSGDIEIVAIADEGFYPVDVASAKNVDTNQEYKIDKSIIHGVTTEAQKAIKIEIQLAKQYSKRRYILGVR